MGESYFAGISDLNELIDIGIYSFDESNGLQSHALECIQNPSLMKTISKKSNIISANTAYYDLGTVVHRNYQILYARFISGGGGGYLVALAFWLDMVRPNGQWDYKVQSGFVNKSFVCIYGAHSSKSVTHTSEWIGNYNYGYTGRFLFSLDILHAGSAAVGGGVEKDKHDWPAIDEGFNDSVAIE